MTEICHYELSESERELLLDQIAGYLSNREEILFAYAHGSSVLGLPFRDIDVAIYLSEDYLDEIDSLDYILTLGNQLSKLVRFPVDVRILNGAPVAFQFHATAGKVLVSRDDGLRLDHTERIRRQYYDFEPMGRLILREVL